MQSQTHVNQIGGNHYEKQGEYQHWDLVGDCNIPYFEANATKYLSRWRDKGGIQDLQKAATYLEKRIVIMDKQPDTEHEFINKYRVFNVPYLRMLRWFESANLEADVRHICALIFNWETKQHLKDAINLINSMIKAETAVLASYVNQ